MGRDEPLGQMVFREQRKRVKGMGSPSEQATTKAGGRSHPECHPLADNSDKK